jgi:hypothetical protein
MSVGSISEFFRCIFNDWKLKSMVNTWKFYAIPSNFTSMLASTPRHSRTMAALVQTLRAIEARKHRMAALGRKNSMSGSRLTLKM